MTTTPLITAVIPVRLSSDRLYDEPGRIERIVDTLPEAYVPLIVDYGTGDERADEIRKLAEKTGTRLLRVETVVDQPFSIGHARDLGTQHAQTPLVMYHDIDFILSPRNYERVLDEARLRGMPENVYAFFALPGAYLTEEFTQKYLELFAAGDAEFADVLLHDGIMRADRTVYSQHTYAISAIVASRYHLLAIGGHDRSFSGHGAEDFELMHRLSAYAQKGPRTFRYYENKRNNSIQKYEGFRAYFALYGIDVFQRGLQVAHLWHPRRSDASYVAPMAENQQRVSHLMEDYDTGKTWLRPLEDIHSEEHTLVLVKDEKSPPIKALRHAFPAFGRYEIRQEGTFQSGSELVDHVRQNSFSRIFFLNPYGNDHRLSLYQAVRQAGLRFVVWDRGGLSDSWFFDSGGFLADSSSYAPERWDKPLDAGDRERTVKWLEAHRDSEPLEVNGARIGAEALRSQLGAGDRKVVFVALQRPEDTATKHFAGPCAGFDGFNRWIGHLAAHLDPKTHVVVAKKHPLEAEAPRIDGVHMVDGQTHFMDLIDLADVVVVINSGTGLVALSCGKPVVCCGDSYYSHEGLAESAFSEKDLVAAVRNATPPDEDRKIRFFHYLIDEFYSFGKSFYKSSTVRGAEIRRVTRILFSSIRGLEEKPIMLGSPPCEVDLEAPLFFSYGGKKSIEVFNAPIEHVLKQTRRAARQTHVGEVVQFLETLHARAKSENSIYVAIRKMASAARKDGNPGFAATLLGLIYHWKPDVDENEPSGNRIGNCVEQYASSLVELTLTPVSELRIRATEAFAQKRYLEAIRIFNALHLRQPEETRYLRCLAECYVNIGDSKSAIDSLELALESSQGHKMIERRKRNIKRHFLLRPFFPGRPFSVGT